ncbi:MAG: NAD(P)-dependent alcohol dehydrogenase [Spirochaeta sp.]|jgi:NADPH:quinone reductase-like Zn-dependent oxidoreductase|nr:NAD(P)-dependent alcohol dehydrogenase [Spirochaeta sp.]
MKNDDAERSAADNTHMRALTVPRYGGPDVLIVTQMPRPIPGAGETLVRVAWGAINAADWRLMRADPWMVRLAFGLRRPRFRALGIALSGTVVESRSKRFPIGTRVAADLSAAGCNAFAEYVCIADTDLATVPDAVELDQAAALPLAGTTALQALRDHATVESGARVLVTGASGAVGSLAVQVARDMGAEVWAVTRANQAPMVAGLGAAQILDRESEDPISHTARSNVRFDSIVDTSGERNIFDYASILAPTGTYILVGGPMTRLAQAAIVGSMRSHRNGKTWKTFTAKANAADLSFLLDRAAHGAIHAPIGARLPLTRGPEAMRLAEEHAVPGRVLIDMA